MATTQNEHNGNGTVRRFSFTFPYIKEDDVKVSVRTNNANVTTLASNTYTFPSATEIQLNAVAETDFKDVLKLNPDGIFLSNGPGDPEPCEYAINNIKEFLKQSIPIFGICLGHQLMGLAAGLRTYKLRYGHRGANQPVVDLETGRVYITSQNHGFAVDIDSLSDNHKITHKSLFDDSLQGVELKATPASGFQGHPEASPGPKDIYNLFTKFIHNRRNANA